MKQFAGWLIFCWILVSCNNKSSNTDEQNRDSTVITDTSAVVIKRGYDFERHDNILVFMEDLQKAITINDRSAVVKMMNFPFVDHWPNFIKGNEETGEKIDDLSAKDSTELLSKFDQVFMPEMVARIREKKYRGFEKSEHLTDIIEEGEYLILAEAPINKRQYGLAIKKINGMYKIYRMAFSS